MAEPTIIGPEGLSTKPIEEFPHLWENVQKACREMGVNCGKFRFFVAPGMERVGGAHFPIGNFIFFGKDVFDERHKPHIMKHELAHDVLERWVNVREEHILSSLSPGVISVLSREPANSLFAMPPHLQAFQFVKEVTTDIYAGAFMSGEEVEALAEYKGTPEGYGDLVKEAIEECRTHLRWTGKADRPLDGRRTLVGKMDVRECALERAIGITNELCEALGES